MPIFAKSVNKLQSSYEEIVAGIGQALDEFEVFHNQVLVGIFIREAKTDGGLILPTSTQNEDRYQGKSAVVLKKGPWAFVDTDSIQFKNDVSVGDWIIHRVSDGSPIDINGIACKLIEDVHIKGRIIDHKTIY